MEDTRQVESMRNRNTWPGTLAGWAAYKYIERFTLAVGTSNCNQRSKTGCAQGMNGSAAPLGLHMRFDKTRAKEYMAR